MQHLRIYEMNYSVSPNGVDEWEVLSEDGETLKSFAELDKAINYAYLLGGNFTVYTLSAWEEENGTDVPTATTKEWSLV